MSALGRLVVNGDFDSNGQIVVQTPAERVIERSVVVTRTVTEVPPSDQGKPAPQPKAETVQDHTRHNAQPPLPYPLAPRPVPSDLRLDKSRDGLLTAFGKA